MLKRTGHATSTKASPNADGSALYFEDHAEAAVLSRNRLSADQRWTGLILRNLREQISYRIGENADLFQYRTRAGVVVPLAWRAADSTIGLIPIRGNASRAAIAAAHSFLRKYAGGKAVLVTDGEERRVIDERTMMIPATQLLWP